MRRSRRVAWWGAYALGAAGVIGGLAWTSVRVVQLEREERAARRDAERQETMRAALWRLDFWLAPRLARESARTWFEFEPYHPQTIAYNRLLEPIAEGEVLLPSPLLTFSSPYLVAHFQWRASTGFTSPQVPSEALVSMGVVGCEPVPSDPDRRAHLNASFAQLDPQAIERRLQDHESLIDKAMGDNRNWVTAQSRQESSKSRASLPPADDYRARQSASNSVQQALIPQVEGQTATQLKSQGRTGQRDTANGIPLPGLQQDQPGDAATSPVDVGPMLPLWLSREPARLVLARRVRFPSETVLQGVLIDWPELRRALLGEIESIAPGADLEPTDDIVGDDAQRMASIPAVLKLASLTTTEEAGIADHPAALGLALVWCAALGAIAISGLALRSSIGSAVRTSRFASSVTHELRTPLTTFRLYAEMLADGMVRDEERKREYYVTLRDESARLGLLVENVLAWSRAEDGRSPRELRTTTLGAIRATVEPVLARRCAEAGAAFSVVMSTSDDTAIVTDMERLGQILFNFVDNASKYAGQGAAVALHIETIGKRAVFAIEDSGPGVPDRLRARIFRAFDRGERGPGDAVRGLGLGLAISAELAAALRGRLRCERSALGGARFALEVPLD